MHKIKRNKNTKKKKKKTSLNSLNRILTRLQTAQKHLKPNNFTNQLRRTHGNTMNAKALLPPNVINNNAPNNSPNLTPN